MTSRVRQTTVLVERLAGAPDPESLFLTLASRPGCFFLDSALPGPASRFSFLGCHPYRIVRAQGRSITDTLHGTTRRLTANPVSFLRSVLPAVAQTPPDQPLPFVAGAVGFLSYDLGRFIEHLPARAPRDQSLDDLYLAFYDSLFAYDHLADCCYVTARSTRGHTHAREILDRSLRLLGSSGPVTADTDAAAVVPGTPASNFTRDQYLRTVRRAIDYIAAGDIFQVNLSQRFQARSSLAPHQLYLRLRRANPAPYAAFISIDPDRAALSSSPEQFLHVSGRDVRTRPIKGTRPRLADPMLDAQLREELVNSPKDNAELAMIVDLERNDLGRVCSYGSVHVAEPRVLESFARVHHLVATVTGKIHPGRDLTDLLRATFPGGSITGAPKIRAQEIIDELEPTARSVYTGSIGYFDHSGNADLNIAIRTLLYDHHNVSFQVGGGIVADSSPELEYQETLDKALGLVEALGVPPDRLVLAEDSQ